MKFEESPYFDSIKHTPLKMDYGMYYLCDDFVIGELNEGIHFDTKKTTRIGKKIIDHYGTHPKICLISNRINSYSVDPQNWKHVMEIYPNILKASCIVSYSKLSQFNADLEKRFFTDSIMKFDTLDEAIHWAQNLD